MRNGFIKRRINDTRMRIVDVAVDSIRPNPDQLRKTYDRESLERLAQSIRLHGILQPIIVRRISSARYQLIAGERRLLAARMLGLESVPCIVYKVDSDDAAVLALSENIHREPLSFFDEAKGVSTLIHYYGLTLQQVSARLGCRQAAITDKLRLLRMSDKVRARISSLGLTECHARTLLALPGETQQLTVLSLIEERGLNVSQTKELVRRRLEPKAVKVRKPVGLFRDARIFVNTINGALEAIERSGMLISSEKSEDDDSIEYIIKLKKSIR